jgi:type I restriction-modification system DNA methylase subunit
MAAVHSKATQAEHGQFFTPWYIAQFMTRLSTELLMNMAKCLM